MAFGCEGVKRVLFLAEIARKGHLRFFFNCRSAYNYQNNVAAKLFFNFWFYRALTKNQFLEFETIENLQYKI